MSNAFIPYARQSISQEDIAAVTSSLSNEFITRGPLVEEFERSVAEYCGAKYAVAFSNASTALLAACQAANVSKFDRFICTPNTFITSVSAGMHCGAEPIFIDIDRTDGGMNIEQIAFTLEKRYSQGRSVIMPVHFAGIPVDMAKIDSIIKDPNAVVIEDAAHAIGSLYSDGQRVGCCAHSQMTVFSFHPAKTITTGEGGMVTTNDPMYDQRLRLLRNSGIERAPERLENPVAPWYYEVQVISNNFNMTEFQAALGLSQLKRLDDFAEKRRQLTGIYRSRLSSFNQIRLFDPAYDSSTTYHLFVAQIDFKKCGTSRAAVMEQLRDRGIGTQVHYIPIYRHPAIKNVCGNIEAYFPEMESYYQSALTLPLYADLKVEQVHQVCDNLLELLHIKI